MAAAARLVCVSRDGARGAPSWLGRDAETHTFCFMSDGTLAPASARSEVLGLQCGGWARGRAAAALFLEERGARGGGASGRSYGSPPPMVVALRARKGSLCGVHS